MFSYKHQVQFYETDLMGIVHHANYLRIFEEARVAWGMAGGVIDPQKPQTASEFTVVSTEVRHLKPSRFADCLKIELQVKLKRAQVVFEYKMWNEDNLIAEARTTHVAVDENLQVLRPSPALKKVIFNELEKCAWKETWLSSLSE